jgi:hypothetical protein
VTSLVLSFFLSLILCVSLLFTPSHAGKTKKKKKTGELGERKVIITVRILSPTMPNTGRKKKENNFFFLPPLR